MPKTWDFYRQNGIRYRGGLPDHVVRVPKLQSFPDRRFHPVGEERKRVKRQGVKTVQLMVCSVCRTVRLARNRQSTDDSSKEQIGGHLGLQSTRSAHGSLRQNDQRLEASGELAGKGASLTSSTMASRRQLEEDDCCSEAVHGGRQPQRLGLGDVAGPASRGERGGGLRVRQYKFPTCKEKK